MTNTTLRHRRTGATVELISRSALDSSVINYRDANGNTFAGYASDYETVDDDAAEQAEARFAIIDDTL